MAVDFTPAFKNKIISCPHRIVDESGNPDWSEMDALPQLEASTFLHLCPVCYEVVKSMILEDMMRAAIKEHFKASYRLDVKVGGI